MGRYAFGVFCLSCNFARVLKTAQGCPWDFDEDGDVDGFDEFEYLDNPAAMDMADFGRADCSQE